MDCDLHVGSGSSFSATCAAGGLAGVQLVISDAHAGLVAAVGTVLQGAAWQRCRVHFMRNVLTEVPKADADMVATWIRTIFTMGTPGAVRPRPARPRRRHPPDQPPTGGRDAA